MPALWIGDMGYVTMLAHFRSNTRKVDSADVRPSEIHWWKRDDLLPRAIHALPTKLLCIYLRIHRRCIPDILNPESQVNRVRKQSPIGFFERYLNRIRRLSLSGDPK